MRLLKSELLKGCKNSKGMEDLLIQAEKTLQTWQPTWSPFISASLREEAMKRIVLLHDVDWYCNGGHPGAERQRMLCVRSELNQSPPTDPLPICGIRIEGNFLFDKVSPKDIRTALKQCGAPSDGLGDIWTLKDIGGEAICTPETAAKLNGKLE